VFLLISDQVRSTSLDVIPAGRLTGVQRFGLIPETDRPVVLPPRDRKPL